MEKERQLARSIRAKQPVYPVCNNRTYVEVEGVKLTFPFQHRVDTAPWDAFIDPFIWDNYEVCEQIIKPEIMPREWIPFLKEVERLRKLKGTDYPIDPVTGIFNLSLVSSRFKELGLPNFESEEFPGPCFTDKEQIIETINKIIADQQLRKEFKEVLATQIPDMGASQLSQEQLLKFLQEQQITNGLALDLGCGLGQRTQELASKTSLGVVGVDRLYKQSFYKQFWTDKDNSGLSFVRADFSEGLPLKDNAADAAIMENVTPYLLEKNLAQALKEIKRVLKDGGFLFVGPQGFQEWRVFKNVKTDQGTSLEELTMTALPI